MNSTKSRIQSQHTEICCTLNIKNEASERETKKTIPFKIAPKIIKYLGINLTKEKRPILQKLLEETEDSPNKWKDIPCSWIGRINIIKMSILPMI